MSENEKDFMSEVRKKWIYQGRERDENGEVKGFKKTLLMERMDLYDAQKIWDRILFVAKTAAGIGRNKTPTPKQQERAREIAERLLQVIYEETESIEEEPGRHPKDG